MAGHREPKEPRDGGAAAALEYLRALRGDDEELGDESPETVPLLSGPDAVTPTMAAEADAAVDSGSAGAEIAGARARVDGGGEGAAARTVAPAPVAVADPPGSALAEEWVTCPECGAGAMIDPAQRRAEDFCPNCDFPLFWARASVIAMASDETGASLRRLPGTVGRAATASVACPHCGEPNSPIAEVCIRCGLPMVLAPEPEPEPEPIIEYVPEPEPVIEEPEDSMVWLVVLCAAVAVLLLLIGLYFQFG